MTNTFKGTRTLSKTDHMLGYKESINKFQKIETIQSVFLHHNGIKPDINNKRINRKVQMRGN